MTEQKRKVIHFYSRAGFGIPAEYYFDQRTLQDHIDKQFKTAKTPILFSIRKDYSDEQMMARADIRKKRRKESRVQAKRWFEKMSNAKDTALLEKMSLFWHGHLACRIIFGQKIAGDYINAIRKNALGNFRELLLTVSKTPAMIRYLNNQQNKKESPNENFARELLELFTLGRGHYTEKDIKEAARAFTGWSSTLKGKFIFRSSQHDYGSKEFMGEKGDFNGEDIIDIILSKKACAAFISKKIYQYFVSDDIPELRHAELTEIFYNNHYEIEPLLRKIFESDWFYDEHIINQQIKSPIHLLAQLGSLSKLEFNNRFAFEQVTKLLGQRLLDPPNVAGWPGGRQWIDNASLALRMNMGLASLNKDLKRKINVKSDTQNIYYHFKNVPESRKKSELSVFLLNTDLSEKVTFPKMKVLDKKENFDKYLVALMSQLEFQMC